MQETDLKIGMLNIIALMISFSNQVEATLKIVLLLVSIVYTCIRILDYFKGKKIKE